VVKDFLKTFKQDIVAIADLSSIVAKQLLAWFKEYNQNALYRSLQLISPRVYP
jgi:hypothetical protein